MNGFLVLSSFIDRHCNPTLRIYAFEQLSNFENIAKLIDREYLTEAYIYTTEYDSEKAVDVLEKKSTSSHFLLV